MELTLSIQTLSITEVEFKMEEILRLAALLSIQNIEYQIVIGEKEINLIIK